MNVKSGSVPAGVALALSAIEENTASAAWADLVMVPGAFAKRPRLAT